MPDIHTIGICGVGQMGAATAVSFKRAGYRVLAWDHDPAQLAALPKVIGKMEMWLDEHFLEPGPDEIERGKGGSIEPRSNPESLDRHADVILECITEDMAHKVALFKRFPGCLKRGCLFLTTTSGLSITELGRRSNCGHLLTGTHFWNPPHLMPLVEVIRGEDTPDHIVSSVFQLVQSIGKIPVRVNRDVPGFIGNRLLHALWREAINLVETGVASPEDIDLVARLTFGLRMPVMGPLENMDLVGLDLIETIHQYLLEDIADNHRPSEYLAANVHQGNLGHKSGRGFYDWTARSAQTLIESRDRQIVHQLKYLNELDSEG